MLVHCIFIWSYTVCLFYRVDVDNSMYHGVCDENSTLPNRSSIFCHCVNGETGKCGVNFETPMCDPDGGMLIIQRNTRLVNLGLLPSICPVSRLSGTDITATLLTTAREGVCGTLSAEDRFETDISFTPTVREPFY